MKQGGGGSISEDIKKLKDGQVGKFDLNSKTGELFNNATSAGLNAHAEGDQTEAAGESSHSEGMGCVANGIYNHVEGYKNVTAGHSSHGEGYQNTITENGNASHAEGRENNISSMFAHAEGAGNTVSGNGAHAEGRVNTISGNNGHVEGYNNSVSGQTSHAEGGRNIVNTSHSHAEGNYNIINGDISHAEGGGHTNVYLTGGGNEVRYEVFSETSWLCQSLTQKELFDYFNYKNSYIVDYESSVYSPIKIIEAEYDSERDIVFITLEKTVSSEPISNKRYGIGRNLINEGAYLSHIEGYSNAINDNCPCSHIENNDNSIVSGTSCHIEGELNFIKNGGACHVEGFCNITNNTFEHAQGTYNLSNTGDTDDKKTLHSVGIGAKGARKNAHEIMRNGDQYIVGIGGYDGTNPETAKSIQEVISELQATISTLQQQLAQQ